MGGVLSRDARVVDIVAAGHESGKLISGHAAGLTGPALQAYLSAGIFSDHEVFAHIDAMEKLRAGMTVELRGAFDYVLPLLVRGAGEAPGVPHPPHCRHRRPVCPHTARGGGHRRRPPPSDPLWPATGAGPEGSPPITRHIASSAPISA